MEAKNFCILCFICFYFLLQVWWWYPIDYSSNGCVVHILGKKPWWVFLTAAVPQMTTCDHLSRGVFASIHWQSAVSIAGFWLFFLSVRHWCDSTAECQPPCETLSVTRCRNEELGRGGGEGRLLPRQTNRDKIRRDQHPNDSPKKTQLGKLVLGGILKLRQVYSEGGGRHFVYCNFAFHALKPLPIPFLPYSHPVSLVCFSPSISAAIYFPFLPFSSSSLMIILSVFIGYSLNHSSLMSLSLTFFICQCKPPSPSSSLQAYLLKN